MLADYPIHWEQGIKIDWEDRLRRELRTLQALYYRTALSCIICCYGSQEEARHLIEFQFRHFCAGVSQNQASLELLKKKKPYMTRTFNQPTKTFDLTTASSLTICDAQSVTGNILNMPHITDSVTLALKNENRQHLKTFLNVNFF